MRRYQARVYAVTLHYLRDREEARDAAQEAFIKLYRNLDSLRQGETFLPWLMRLTRNCAIDRLRRLKTRTPDHPVPVEEGPELASRQHSPEERTHLRRRRDLLHRALAELSDQSREMILLKDIQELKLLEVAELLALPLGTVKSRSHRARLELAEAIQRMEACSGAA